MTAAVDVRGVMRALDMSVGADVSAEKPAAKPKPDERLRRGGVGMAYKIAIRFVNEHPMAVRSMMNGQTMPRAVAKAYFPNEADERRFAVALRAMQLARQLGRGLGENLEIPEVKSGKRWQFEEDAKLLRLSEQYPGNPAKIAREMGFDRSIRAYNDRLYFLKNRKPKG